MMTFLGIILVIVAFILLCTANDPVGFILACFILIVGCNCFPSKPEPTPQDRIDGYVKKIEEQKTIQDQCKHTWNDPVSNPEKIQTEIRTSEYLHPEMVEETVSRWTRTCKECGIKQHTTKMKRALVDIGPKFE